MSLFKDAKISFAGGEITDLLHNRIDMQKYGVWLKEATNVICRAFGSVINRAGFIFNETTKQPGDTVKLVPFIFNEAQAYVLEMGDSYLRVRDNKGPLRDEEGNIFEILSPFFILNQNELNYAQSADVLFFANGRQQQQRLERRAELDWRFAPINFKNGPFMPYNTDENAKLSLEENASETTPAITTVGIDLSIASYYQGQWRHASVWYNNNIIYNADITSIAGFVSGFNANNSAGLSVAQGSNILIFTADTNPETYNGNLVKVKLEYRYLLSGDYPRWWSQSREAQNYFSGGAGSSRADNSILSSSQPIFTEDHVGALFKIDRYVEEQRIDATFGAAIQTQAIISDGGWRMVTSGNWEGKLVIQISRDSGSTWTNYRTTKSGATDQPFNENVYGTIDADETILLRVNIEEISGSVKLLLVSGPFKTSTIVKITSIIDAQNVNALITKNNIGAITATDEWAEGSFSNARGWPEFVFFYEQRLGFAKTKSEPTTLWLGRIDDIESFETSDEPNDNDAITMKLASLRQNEITGIAINKNLIVFTSGSEYVISGNGAPLTQTNKQAVPCSNYGSQKTSPLAVNDKILFIQKQGSVLRRLAYDYEQDGYTAPAFSTIAQHLFENHGIKRIEYAKTPDNIIYLLRDDGVIICFTYMPEENGYAYSRYESQLKFDDICVIPDDRQDQLWAMATLRDDDDDDDDGPPPPEGSGEEGEINRFIMKQAPRLASKEPRDQVFLDACIIKESEEPFDTIEGLEHIQDNDITALADGQVIRDARIDENGVMTLPVKVKKAVAGLEYKQKFTLLPSQISLSNGTTIGTKRRAKSADIFYKDTVGFYYGVENMPTDPAVFRTGEPYNTPTELKTGVKTVYFTSEYNKLQQISIEQRDPLPMQITAIVPLIDYADRV
jgi:hypothetical protein